MSANWARRYKPRPVIGGKLGAEGLRKLTGTPAVDERLRTDLASRRAEIQRLFRIGRTAPQIAKQLGVDIGAVHAALRSTTT